MTRKQELNKESSAAERRLRNVRQETAEGISRKHEDEGATASLQGANRKMHLEIMRDERQDRLNSELADRQGLEAEDFAARQGVAFSTTSWTGAAKMQRKLAKD